MLITIGIKDVARELTFEVDGKGVADTVTKALRGEDDLLDLTDTKGNRMLIPTTSLAYVSIGTDAQPRVGFGA